MSTEQIIVDFLNNEVGEKAYVIANDLGMSQKNNKEGYPTIPENLNIFACHITAKEDGGNLSFTKYFTNAEKNKIGKFVENYCRTHLGCKVPCYSNDLSVDDAYSRLQYMRKGIEFDIRPVNASKTVIEEIYRHHKEDIFKALVKGESITHIVPDGFDIEATKIVGRSYQYGIRTTFEKNILLFGKYLSLPQENGLFNGPWTITVNGRENYEKEDFSSGDFSFCGYQTLDKDAQENYLRFLKKNLAEKRCCVREDVDFIYEITRRAKKAGIVDKNYDDMTSFEQKVDDILQLIDAEKWIRPSIHGDRRFLPEHWYHGVLFICNRFEIAINRSWGTVFSAVSDAPVCEWRASDKGSMKYMDTLSFREFCDLETISRFFRERAENWRKPNEPEEPHEKEGTYEEEVAMQMR